MKFKINRDHFSSGLQQVLNVVGTRTTMPILSNVLIQAESDSISLTTTNLDLGIRCKIMAEVEQSGAITLPMRKLASIVRELPNIDVQVDAPEGKQQAVITSGTANYKIMGLSSEEFPPLPSFTDQHSFVIDQGELARMLRSVSYAQSTDEQRYIMNGVYFNFEDDKLTLVATDGRRLAVISKDMEVSAENAGNLILHAKTVGEVQRLLGPGENVRIAFNERQVAFEINTNESESAETGLLDSIYLVSKIVEGNYPNYRQVIPKENNQHINVNRESLLSCVKRAALMSSDKNHSVKVHIKENELEISSSSPELGESKVNIPISYEGPEVKVAFNPSYMMDPLKALTQDMIIFEFKDELSPGVFRTAENFLCVIMPLRLN